MRWWIIPSLALVGGAVVTLAAGTEPNQLITLMPDVPPKQPVVVAPQDPASIPTVVVTPPPAPAVVQPAHGPSAKTMANALNDLRKPKPPPRPEETAVAANVPPRPQPKVVTPPPPAETPSAPINLLPPPQPTQPNLSEREAWLQRRSIRLDLMTARDLVLAGQPIDARHVLSNAVIHFRLFPMERSNQQQVEVAIRALDGGDTVNAVRAIEQVIHSPFSSS